MAATEAATTTAAAAPAPAAASESRAVNGGLDENETCFRCFGRMKLCNLVHGRIEFLETFLRGPERDHGNFL